MNSIKINASSSYNVYIGAGILCDLGAISAKVIGSGTVAVISDSNVWPFYGEIVKMILHDSGLHVVSYVFPAGEDSKNTQTYISLLNFLAENELTRSDLIVALGGGVVGDLAGFAAATYLRGIQYIQIPTTLLAMVDSSVGGKTAIDLPSGKNLAGAFYQPSAVICDTDLLRSLPEEVYREGCAEIIKYAILFDRGLFAHLEEHGLSFDKEAVISKCIAFKSDVVVQDEFDTGYRHLLNFGHTIGHAVEYLSHFTLSHGNAVAIGMSVVTRAAAYNALCDHDTMQRILTLLDQFQLSTHTDFSADCLCTCAYSDKKRSGNDIHLIIPKEIGQCTIQSIPITELKSFIEAGL